jgi:hypothetical protein
MSFKSNRPVLLGSRRQFLLLIFLLAIGCSAQAQNGEEYRAYEAVLGHMFKGGVTRFDMNAKIDKIVLRSRTRSEYASDGSKENWEQVQNRLKGLREETISGYESARKTEVELKPDLNIPFEYTLITDAQLAKIFPPPRGIDREIAQWLDFYKAYPNSAGHNSLSRVGFDKAGTQALVYFVNWCGIVCGTGTYLLLEKDEKGWAVSQTAGIWIS